MGCRKSLLRCDCWSNPTKPVKETTKVKGKDGRERTVTRNSKTVTVDARGIEWCARCRCRVMNGTCSNVTCSTRKT
ncbi:MAG TPA: hypothetical protein VIL55_11695 [Naasia sp.]|jgi:hypothetical protein